MKKQKVIIQHAQDSLGLEYKNHTYEASLRVLDSGWYSLESLEDCGTSNDENLPILHKGFFDAHLHAFWCGEQQKVLRLNDAQSLEEATKKILKYSENKYQEITVATGWDESHWNHSHQEVVKYWNQNLPQQNCFLLSRICGHSAWVSEAFKKKVNLPTLPSFVSEKTYFDLLSQLPQPTVEERKLDFLNIQNSLIQNGISAISEMSLDDTKLQALKELCDEGKLLIDVIGILDAKKAPQAIRDGVLFKKNSSPLGPLDREAYLTVRHWKRFLDGSFGSHTAWLSGFYSDKETYGESQEDFPELFLQARNALRSGFYLSFHVIGDAALDQALMLGEKLKLEMKSRSVSDGLNPLTPTQHRLEHVQLCRNDQLLTIKNQGFWSLAIQPSHRVLDDKFIHSRLGSKRYEDFAYRLATFEKNLIPFAVSSDAPIAGFNPQENFLANQKHPEKEKLNFDSLIWKMTTGGRLALGANSPLLKRGSTVRMSARSCINDKI